MRVLLLFMALAFGGGVVLAETVTAKVSYVAAKSVYIDAGSAQGIQRGDSGAVAEKGMPVARLVVEFVAEKTSSCRLLDSVMVRVGDEVTLHVAASRATEVKPTAAAVSPALAAPASLAAKKPLTNHARFTGTLGLQVLGQVSHDQLDYQYYQPGLVMRAKVENLFGGGPTLNVRMNLRREYRNLSRADVPKTEWLNRVYEVSLSYAAPEARVNYSVGRLLSNHLAGIGYLDGAQFGARVADHLEAGAFAGTEPDLRTTDVRTSLTKGGAYAAYQRGVYSGEWVNATVAAAGEYYKGQISREFVYEQINYGLAQQLSAYQSAEINVNRGWRKTANTSALELTNCLFNVRYAPLKALGITAGYDNHTTYRTYETRSIADSLFDTALQQGYRLGFDVRLPWAMQADAQGGLRTRRGDSKSTRTVNAGLGMRDLARTRVFLGGRITTFTGPFSSGYQPTAMVSRMFFNRLTLGLQTGWDIYDLSGTNQHVRSAWQRVSADGTINRLLYGSANYELYRGDNLNGSRYYVEIGCRL